MSSESPKEHVLICRCHAVTNEQLTEVIASGARTVRQVGRACGAGTGCGRCLHRISVRLAAVCADSGPDHRKKRIWQKVPRCGDTARDGLMRDNQSPSDDELGEALCVRRAQDNLG